MSGRFDVVAKESDAHRVVAIATPGAPIFELAIVCEVFGIDRAHLARSWYDFAVVPTHPETVLAPGFAVPGLPDWDRVAYADTVIVPACTGVHVAAAPPLLEALQHADRRGARIAAICSGAFVLAQAGLLRGRRAATHWMHADELAHRYPDTTVDASVLYVHDHVWTSAGTTAGIDMCLELVRCDHGAAVADAVARAMVTPPHRDGDQAQYGAPATGRDPQDRTGLGRLQDWARDHLDTVSVTRLAQHAGISERTLHRRFTTTVHQTPQQWIQRERILVAQQFLETTDHTLATIARRTGLGTATNLRQQFTAALHTTPSRYRDLFHLTRRGDA